MIGRLSQCAGYVRTDNASFSSAWKLDEAVFFFRDRSGFNYRIDDRDESGFRALDELRGRGMN